jgi:hypothetical protein
LRQEGWSVNQLADEFEISRQRVQQILRPDKVKARKARWRRNTAERHWAEQNGGGPA